MFGCHSEDRIRNESIEVTKDSIRKIEIRLRDIERYLGKAEAKYTIGDAVSYKMIYLKRHPIFKESIICDVYIEGGYIQYSLQNGDTIEENKIEDYHTSPSLRKAKKKKKRGSRS